MADSISPEALAKAVASLDAARERLRENWALRQRGPEIPCEKEGTHGD